MTKAIDKNSFRQIMGRFATGVAVVTAQNAALGAFGLTINSLASVSLAPPLLLFCLDRQARLYNAFIGSESFAINLLAATQENISRHFASRQSETPEGDIWEPASSGSPVLRDSLGWILCRRFALYAGGDHMICVGEVTQIAQAASDANPLLYFRSRYRQLGPDGSSAG